MEKRRWPTHEVMRHVDSPLGVLAPMAKTADTIPDFDSQAWRAAIEVRDLFCPEMLILCRRFVNLQSVTSFVV